MLYFEDIDKEIRNKLLQNKHPENISSNLSPAQEEYLGLFICLMIYERYPFNYHLSLGGIVREILPTLIEKYDNGKESTDNNLIRLVVNVLQSKKINAHVKTIKIRTDQDRITLEPVELKEFKKRLFKKIRTLSYDWCGNLKKYLFYQHWWRQIKSFWSKEVFKTGTVGYIVIAILILIIGILLGK